MNDLRRRAVGWPARDLSSFEGRRFERRRFLLPGGLLDLSCGRSAAAAAVRRAGAVGPRARGREVRACGSELAAVANSRAETRAAGAESAPRAALGPRRRRGALGAAVGVRMAPHERLGEIEFLSRPRAARGEAEASRGGRLDQATGSHAGACGEPTTPKAGLEMRRRRSRVEKAGGELRPRPPRGVPRTTPTRPGRPANQETHNRSLKSPHQPRPKEPKGGHCSCPEHTRRPQTRSYG